MKISELGYLQWRELVFRLDRCTSMGLFTAIRIAKQEFGDDEIKDVFLKAGMTPRQAAIHAGKVERYGKAS